MSDHTLSATTTTFSVPGMNCGSCVRHIDEAFRDHLPGVAANVDLNAKQVVARFDPSTVSVAAIVRVLDEAGYEAAVV